MKTVPAACSRRVLLLLGLVALLGLVPRATAQGSNQPRVRTHLSAGVARLGDRVRLFVSVENVGTARLLALPGVDGLELGPAGTPSNQERYSNINGRVSFSHDLVWTIPVRPTAAGEYEIPPLEVEIDGAVLLTPPLALTVVEDLRGEELGLCELRVSSQRVVEGQPFSLELRFGWDLGLEGRINFANLSLPWWDSLPGVLAMDPPAPRQGVRQLQLDLNGNDRVSVDELQSESVRGRGFRIFRLLRSYTPARTGRLEFPESFLEFGHAEERGFFSRGRDRESHFVRAPAFAIEVVPLPEDGRPLDFGGAIGSLALRASAEPRDVDAGDSIKLTLEVTGQGNLEFFSAPDPSRLEAYAGFRYFGKTESKAFDRREIVYDLAPLSSSVQEIPPLRLPVFDPSSERYVVLETDPIAIRVRALEDSVALSGGAEARRFERDIADLAAQPRPPRGRSRPGAGVAAGALLAPGVAWLALRLLVRGRADPDRPAERRRRRARRELSRALRSARGPGDVLSALHAFLAARTREAPQAWVGREVARFATEGGRDLGWSGGGAEELALLIAELERAAYGGATLDLDGGRALALADRLVKEGL